jgi:hypothetical protein
MMPTQLVKLCHGTFLNEVLDLFRQRVDQAWSINQINQIEQEHRELLKLYNVEVILRNAIDNHDTKMTFNDAWACAPGRFERLCLFCGGLATVFTNTTSVESDFSILKWELNDNRTALVYLLLEDIFQAKQQVFLQTLLR